MDSGNAVARTGAQSLSLASHLLLLLLLLRWQAKSGVSLCKCVREGERGNFATGIAGWETGCCRAFSRRLDLEEKILPVDFNEIPFAGNANKKSCASFEL